MATIRTTCTTGNHRIELDPATIVLRIDADGPGLGRYSFVCTDCVAVVHRSVSARGAVLLLAGGVEHHPDPSSPPVAPPLTHDDLLDLHELLQHDDWLTDLLDGS